MINTTTTYYCSNATGRGCGRENVVDSEALRHIESAHGVTFCSFCGTDWTWTGESALEAERRKTAEMERQRNHALARADAMRKEADHQERRARSLKGKVTLVKRRIAAGKCPCCHERFPDLAAHVAAKHPGYGDDR